jgi:GNAT superfamily N-acetyltransferase
MTAIRLATFDDLPQLTPLVAAFHQEEGIVSDPKQRDRALIPLLEGSPHGAVYMIGPRNSPMGYVVFSFIWSVEFGGLEAMVDEVYLRHNVRGKGIGKSILKRLFRTMAAPGVHSLSLEVHQKNAKAIQFYKALGFRLRQNYSLMAMEM